VIATEFLRVIANYLQNEAVLNPAPATVGIADPLLAADLPAIVLSVAEIQQLGKGLGERSELITSGALRWTETIDLANPVLPEEPTFRLLSPDRRELVLPHGGLVRADGTEGPIGPADLSVSVDGVARPVVPTNPQGNQVSVDPQVGRLFFATALPATGKVSATYFLGQWEQRVGRISGLLRITVRDTNPTTVGNLSAAVVAALEPPASRAITGLDEVSLITLDSIKPPDSALANSRARAAVLSFQFELKIDRPDSSGGIILRIPVTSNIGAPTIVA
jgi:hypothetical protein